MRSIHDPGKTVPDLAVAIALGGDCLVDAALVRAQPELFGVVASEPTISRLVHALGDDSGAGIVAIRGRGRPPAGRCGSGVARSLLLVRWSSTWTPP